MHDTSWTVYLEYTVDVWLCFGMNVYGRIGVTNMDFGCFVTSGYVIGIDAGFGGISLE